MSKKLQKALKINSLGTEFDTPEYGNSLFTGFRALSTRDRRRIWEDKYENWEQSDENNP